MPQRSDCTGVSIWPQNLRRPRRAIQWGCCTFDLPEFLVNPGDVLCLPNDNLLRTNPAVGRLNTLHRQTCCFGSPAMLPLEQRLKLHEIQTKFGYGRHGFQALLCVPAGLQSHALIICWGRPLPQFPWQNVSLASQSNELYLTEACSCVVLVKTIKTQNVDSRGSS